MKQSTWYFLDLSWDLDGNATPFNVEGGNATPLHLPIANVHLPMLSRRLGKSVFELNSKEQAELDNTMEDLRPF